MNSNRTTGFDTLRADQLTNGSTDHKSALEQIQQRRRSGHDVAESSGWWVELFSLSVRCAKYLAERETSGNLGM